jgi:outer membrane receptor for ferrienterochelin and colicins
MKTVSIVVSACLAILLTEHAMAGEKSGDAPVVKAENTVVTATMTEKIIKDAPGAIDVITGREIREMNAETAADVLEEAAGVFVSTETGRQKRPDIRGTGNNRTLVLIDGRRLAAGFKDLVDLEQISVDLVDRIEVVRGPSSALYGSDAIGGVVNIITKSPPRELKMGLTGQYGQSAYGEGELGLGRAFIGNSSERFGFLLGGGYWEKNGYDRDGVTPDDGDNLSFASAAGRFTYTIDAAHQLKVGLEAFEKDAVGLRDMENLDRERDSNDRRLNYFFQYDGKPTSSSTVMLRVNHSEHENDIDFAPETSLIAGAVGDELDAEQSLNQIESRYSGWLFNRHLLTLGAEYREEEREDASGLDDDIHNLSFYLQDEYQLFEPLYLVAGLRWDEHSDFGSKWTPRASLIYHMLENLRAKASCGKGFRAPGLRELYVPSYMKRGKQIYEPNEDLDPETSESYEIGIEGEYRAFQGRIMWFRNNIDDMIEAVYSTSTGSGSSKKDYYRYQNITEVITSGVEFEWRQKLAMGLALAGNLTWLETEDESTGEDLEGRPDYKGFVKLSYHHPCSGIRANIRVHYIGERYDAEEDEDPVTLVNAYVSKEITDTVKIYGGVDNLFNAGDEDEIEPTFLYAGISLTY